MEGSNTGEFRVTVAQASPIESMAPPIATPDFPALVQEHQSMVYSLALHFLRDPDAAQELSQEVFLQLHRKMGALESSAHVLFWLRRVTCHRCIDSIRRAKARPELSMEDAPEPASAPSVGDPLLRGRLQKLVASLPPDLRAVIVLRYQEDLEPAEIAEVLDLPLRTVRDHLRKGLELLRRKAEIYLGEV
jgi:RNA polymerase sigma-70 factor, ECF subfamily